MQTVELIDRVTSELDDWLAANPDHPLVDDSPWWPNLRAKIQAMKQITNDSAALSRAYGTVMHLIVDSGPGCDIAPSLDALGRVVSRGSNC
ncbi:hypothetical protein Pla22_47440 [Rubripirellula amarantea]|uniref:Uncharacterized protein n=1 Tax=Rubripirellula amarantea TaxID=2527999 RepID=A0A5C5WG82_9BACT|nr:hypothetical protein [Rubripirellula amarantea]TWT49547.1 hypothetical protein Pla22_47440 [Rubripirellula amarantea]